MVGHSIQRQMRWLIGVFKYARTNHPDMRFHGWGVTADRLLHLPFYSVDSSGWTAAVRFARILIRDPRSTKDYAIRLDGRDVYRPQVARVLRDGYGVTPKQLERVTPEHRATILSVAALSTSVHEQRLRRRHGPISAPTWGMLTGARAEDAMNLHMVIAGKDQPDLLEGMHVHLVPGYPGTASGLIRVEGMHVHLATGGGGPGMGDLATMEALHTRAGAVG